MSSYFIHWGVQGLSRCKCWGAVGPDWLAHAVSTQGPGGELSVCALRALGLNFLQKSCTVRGHAQRMAWGHNPDLKTHPYSWTKITHVTYHTLSLCLCGFPLTQNHGWVITIGANEYVSIVSMVFCDGLINHPASVRSQSPCTPKYDKAVTEDGRMLDLITNSTYCIYQCYTST